MRRQVSLDQPPFGMEYQVVHAAGDRAIERLRELDCAAHRGDALLVDERQPVGFHEVAQGTHGTLNEMAVAGYASSIKDRRVQRGRIREDHELRASGREDVPRPISQRIVVEWQDLRRRKVKPGSELRGEANDHVACCAGSVATGLHRNDGDGKRKLASIMRSQRRVSRSR